MKMNKLKISIIASSIVVLAGICFCLIGLPGLTASHNNSNKTEENNNVAAQVCTKNSSEVVATESSAKMPTTSAEVAKSSHQKVGCTVEEYTANALDVAVTEMKEHSQANNFAKNSNAPTIYWKVKGTTLTISGDALEDASSFTADENSVAGWYADERYRNRIETVNILESMNDKAIESTCAWFGCMDKIQGGDVQMSNITNINGFDNLNMSKVVNASFMFIGTKKLNNLSGNIDFSNVKNAQAMFVLSALPGSVINNAANTLTNATNLSYTFSKTKLVNFDIGDKEYSSAINISNMFINCASLKTITAGNLVGNSIENVESAFAKCSALKTIILKYGTDWNEIISLQSSDNLFAECVSLEGTNGTKWNSSNPKNKTYACFDNPSKTGYFSAIEAYAVYKNKILTFNYDLNRYKQGADTTVYDIKTECGDQASQPYLAKADTTTVEISDSFKNFKFKDTAFMFNGLENLTEIININNLNTTGVTSMRNMFENCKALKKLDLRTLDTHAVTNTRSMFTNAFELESLDLNGDNFDTRNLENTRFMFSHCHSLTSLDLTNFNVSKIKDAEKMFVDCPALATIYSGVNWNDTFPADASTSGMFDTCNALKGGSGTTWKSSIADKSYARPDIPNQKGYFTLQKYAVYEDKSDAEKVLTLHYDGDLYKYKGKEIFDILISSDKDTPQQYLTKTETTKVVITEGIKNLRFKNTAYMFNGLESLREIEHLENLNTEGVTSMSNMFYGCKSLKNLDLSTFDTRSVKNVSSMFSYATGLETLNLVGNNFDTSNFENARFMFSHCESLKTLDLSTFNVSKLADMTKMFIQCYQLTTIYSNTNWNDVLPAQSVSTGLFSDCNSLKGGNGTTIKSTGGIIDKTYALPDTSEHQGYFTIKS